MTVQKFVGTKTMKTVVWLAMASCRARPTPSSNWRDALMAALDLPRFLSAGTVRAARMPRMEMTTSNSIKVKA